MTNDAAQKHSNDQIGVKGPDAANRDHSETPESKGSRVRYVVILAVLLVVVAVLVITGIVPRLPCE